MEEQAFAKQYSTQEKLLLAQAVHKLGAAQWDGISTLLTNHPVMRNYDPKRLKLFTPAACEEAYVGLMTDIGINVPVEGGTNPLDKTHLRFAQTFYIARLAELKAAIIEYEQRFTTLMTEIHMIKAGEMDASILSELRAVLVRKYGKRKLDSWVPEPEAVGAAVAAIGREGEDAGGSAEEVKKKEVGEAQVDGEARKNVEGAGVVPVPTKPARGRPRNPTKAPEAATSETSATPATAPTNEVENAAGDIGQIGEAADGGSAEAKAPAESTSTPAPAPVAETRRGRPRKSETAAAVEKEDAARTVGSAEDKDATPAKPEPTRRTSRKKEASAPLGTPAPEDEPAKRPPAPVEEAKPAESERRSTRRKETPAAPTPAPVNEAEEDVEMEEPEVPEPVERVEAPKAALRESRRNTTKRGSVDPSPAPPSKAAAAPVSAKSTKAATPAPAHGTSPSNASDSELSELEEDDKDVPTPPPVDRRGSKADGKKRSGRAAGEDDDGETAEPAKREKRKATQPPSDAPATGKRGRRGVSPVPTITTVPDSEAEAEEKERADAGDGDGDGEGAESEADADSEAREDTPTLRHRDSKSKSGRKCMPAPGPAATATATATPASVSGSLQVGAPAKRGRGRPPRDSPAVSARTKDSSPAISRRAMSVSSTTSGAPKPESATPSAGAPVKRGPGRPPKVRPSTSSSAAAPEAPASPAVSTADNKTSGAGEDEKPVRSSARRRGVEADVSVSLTPAVAERGGRRGSGSVAGGAAIDKSEGRGERDKDRGKERDTGGRRGKAEVEEDEKEPEKEERRSKRSSIRTASHAPPSVTDDDRHPAAADEPERRGPTPREQKTTTKMLMGLLDQIGSHKNGNIFQNPVRESDAPDYFDIVKRPMDLKTVRQRLRDGHITNIDEFERDVHLIFTNAMMYNDEDSPLYDMAAEMLKDAEHHIVHYRATQDTLRR